MSYFRRGNLPILVEKAGTITSLTWYPLRLALLTDSEMTEYIEICIVAVVLHELAHVLVARLMGIRIKRVGISWIGPYLVREQGLPLASFLTSLAGPVTNLLVGVFFWKISPQFGLVNLVLGAYNLIPFIRGLDGYNALRAYRQLAASPSTTVSN